MTATEALNRLADLAGIEPDYWDIWGNHHAIGDDAKQRILKALGFPAHDDETVQASMKRLEEREWHRRLAPAVIARAGHDAYFTLTVPAVESQQTLSITCMEEGGPTTRLPLTRPKRLRSRLDPSITRSIFATGFRSPLSCLPAITHCPFKALRGMIKHR